MGKKRIIKKTGGAVDQSLTARSMGRLPKTKMTSGILHIQSTYNNTLLSLTDEKGNVVITRLNEALLKDIASKTGGLYIQASSKRFALGAIYKERLSRIKKTH